MKNSIENDISGRSNSTKNDICHKLFVFLRKPCELLNSSRFFKCAGASKNSTRNDICPNRLIPEKKPCEPREVRFFDLLAAGEKFFHLQESPPPPQGPTQGSGETPEGRTKGAPLNKDRRYGAKHHQSAHSMRNRCALIARIAATGVKKEKWNLKH